MLVRLLATCLAVATPGCLLGKPLVPDDADVTPLIPPSILPDDQMPAGNSNVIVLTTPNPSLQFQLHVVAPNGEMLIGKWALDRLNTCSLTLPTACGNILPPVEVPATEPGGIATFTQSIAFPMVGHCYLVDFYVSPSFQPTGDATLPSRAGDAAHESWVVVTPRPDGTFPLYATCGMEVN